MRISDDEQNCRDLDWYCVDIQGRVGHFASAGFKQVPQSVAESAEDLASLHEFFSSLPAIPNAHVLDDRLTSEHRTERYLHSFVAMADRGLFSYDVETYLTPDTHYFRAAIPKQPLRFLDLPTKVREVLSRTTLSSSSLEECSTIPYLTTLNL